MSISLCQSHPEVKGTRHIRAQNMSAIRWTTSELKSPHLPLPVPVVAAYDIPYIHEHNMRQVLNVYTRSTEEKQTLIGSQVVALLTNDSPSPKPKVLVYIHGGAWRDPFLRQTAIEAAAAHVFADTSSSLIETIVSIDYTLSPFPGHPTSPYDMTSKHEQDSSREARHPDHVRDVFCALSFLRELGLRDGNFILAGHSAGAWLVFSSMLRSPNFYGFGMHEMTAAPIPAAMLGINGLYDLKNLVHELGPSHQHLEPVYEDLIGIAFGSDESKWNDASPATVDAETLSRMLRLGRMANVIMLDQSLEDQLVPVNQTDRFVERLNQVEGLKVVRGTRCTGRHAAPWEEGNMLWATVKELLSAM